MRGQVPSALAAHATIDRAPKACTSKRWNAAASRTGKAVCGSTLVLAIIDDGHFVLFAPLRRPRRLVVQGVAAQ